MLFLKNKEENSLDNFKRFDPSNWDELKLRLSYKLVSRKVFHSSNDIEDFVYKDSMDLTKVCIVSEVSQNRKNIISYALKQEDLKKFDMTEEEVIEQTNENYHNDRLLRIRSLKEDAVSRETMAPLMTDFDCMSLSGPNQLIEDYDEDKHHDNVLIASNKYNVFGASYMLNQDFLNLIYNRMKGAFYILPMSVHQIMCVSKDYVTKNKDAYEAEDDLLDMLFEINSKNKNVEDILSYKIYEYLPDDGCKLFAIKQNI